MASVTVDWAAIEAAYITSDKSYKTLARERGVSSTQCARMGKAGGWPQKRIQYRAQNAQKAIERQARKDVDKLEKLMDAADWLAGVLAGIRHDGQQFNRHLVSEGSADGTFTSVEKIFEKLDTKAIRDLTSATKDMTYVMRNLYGLPTQAEAEAQRVAAERLKLEQAKAQKEEQESCAEYVFALSDEAKKYAK